MEVLEFMIAGNSTFFIKFSTTTIVSVLLLSGCDAPLWQTASTNQQEESSGTAASLRSAAVRQPSSPQESYNRRQSTDTDNGILAQPYNTGKSLDAGASAGIPPHKTSPPQSPADADSSWNPDEPALHGLSLGETREAAEKRYGKPIDEYAMNDDNGSLQVCEFEGFTVGYDDNGRVKYVEVYDTSVNTGLRGLAVGDTEARAVELLGKPGNQTDYTLGYKAKNTLLKMDLDPDNHSILSIKLFPIAPKP
jgi:hypothetical protein